MRTVNEPCAKTTKEYNRRMLALKDAIDLLSGKWKFRILLNLHQYETLRFSDLKETCKGITPKVLSNELQQLEENFMITRSVINSKPISVSYAMTEHAKDTWPVIRSLIDFGLRHREVIKEESRK